MEFKILHDKSVILNYLKQNTELQIYSIGDLDDFFWSKTIWFALVDGETVKSIILLYAGLSDPTVLAIHHQNSDNTSKLLKIIKPLLPYKFYAHLSPGLIELFSKQCINSHSGTHYKMVLKKSPPVVVDDNIQKLSTADLKMIEEFYALAYPDNWFDKKMLDTNKYYGYFMDNKLVGIAGIHVYSPEYKVAALGNITTHPDYRGQKIAYKLTSVLCSDLKNNIDTIGLNVKADNTFAIKSYQKVGFEIVDSYVECLMINK